MVDAPAGYENTHSLIYDLPAATTTHTFSGIVPGDVLYVEVTVNGDFNNANEFATVYIDGDLVGQMEDHNVANGTDIVGAFSFEAAEFSDWLADGELVVEVVNSFTVNTTQGGENKHTVAVRTEGFSWLSNTPTEGVLAAFDMMDVSVGFDATDLSPGDYSSEILVVSNDLLQAEVAIPCHLTVVGSPQMSWSPLSVDFGAVIVGSAASDSVSITKCRQRTFRDFSCFFYRCCVFCKPDEPGDPGRANEKNRFDLFAAGSGRIFGCTKHREQCGYGDGSA